MSDRMHTEDRHRRILNLLDPEAVVSIDTLTRELRSSPATIRRDLEKLSKLGKLRRVHGGALPPQDGLTDARTPARLVGQQAYQAGEVLNVKAKRAIAAKALEYCKEGEGVIIDGGTTTNMLAQFMPNEPFQVLTTSLPIVMTLIHKPNIRLLLSGGEIFREQNIFLSPYEDTILQNFTAAKIFIGAQAISPNGLMQSDPLLVQNERRLIARAHQVIALVDSSKFTNHASLSSCPLTGIHTLITDEGIADKSRAMLKKAGVEVIIAPPS
jgi:DeoR family transcriptional regulator, ulaG and ulaABCDEF operon transcriptional repressor